MISIKRFKDFDTSIVVDNGEKVEESVPQQKTVDQMEMVRKMTKGIDIGDRITDLEKEGANIVHSRNAIDNGVESFQDYEEEKWKTLSDQNAFIQKFHAITNASNKKSDK